MVQYQGGAQVRLAILGGDIDMTFATLNEAKPLLEDGKSLPVAVTTRERVPSMPDVTALSLECSGRSEVFRVSFRAPHYSCERELDRARRPIPPQGSCRRKMPFSCPKRFQSKAGPGSVLRPGAMCSWPRTAFRGW